MAEETKEPVVMTQKECTACLVVCLMHARTNGHIMHLQTQSYAQHMALGAFYDGLGDFIDSFVEAYQGLYGILDGFPDNTYEPPSKDCLAEIIEIGREIKVERRNTAQDTELQNILDEIAALIDATIYKLRFLK